MQKLINSKWFNLFNVIIFSLLFFQLSFGFMEFTLFPKILFGAFILKEITSSLFIFLTGEKTNE